MAKQTINVGSGEYTGDGESLRSALVKTNDNFDEVYTNFDSIINAGYLTAGTLPPYPTVPTNVGDFNNNVGYLTTDTLPPYPIVKTDQLTSGTAVLTLTSDGNLTLPASGNIRDATSNISVLKTRIGDTYASGAFQQLTIVRDEGKLITIAGGNSLFRLPQLNSDLLGAEFEFYFSGVAGQVYIQSYYTGVRATTDVFRGSIYVGVDNATTGKLHTATATTSTACNLFLGQHHAKAGSYIKVKAIAFDVVGTWMFQGMCVGDTGQTPNDSDHPFQDYN